ncbi:hypothetical protein BDR03DRAFT_944323 [Suillus americanus]|nr:hypothetical protein BDR03DRAFT_944323 [Suillus americanus]
MSVLSILLLLLVYTCALLQQCQSSCFDTLRVPRRISVLTNPSHRHQRTVSMLMQDSPDFMQHCELYPILTSRCTMQRSRFLTQNASHHDWRQVFHLQYHLQM